MNTKLLLNIALSSIILITSTEQTLAGEKKDKEKPASSEREPKRDPASGARAPKEAPTKEKASVEKAQEHLTKANDALDRGRVAQGVTEIKKADAEMLKVIQALDNPPKK